MPTEHTHKTIIGIFLMTLLYALHYGIPMYVTSSFLTSFFSQKGTSLLFALGSLVTFFVSLHITQYIKKYHTYGFTQGLLILEFIVTMGLAFTHNPLLLAFFFVIHFVCTALLYISINTLMESIGTRHEIGMMRGMFLTVLNAGIIISPFFAGAILERGNYGALYIVSSCMLLPFMFLLRRYMKDMPEPAYTKIEIGEAFKQALRNRDIRTALITMFLLECFYAVMVIYSPLFLITKGISLFVYLSILLPIALIPLIILPYELGILADTKTGEKELMILGLLIMSASTMFFAITDTTHLYVWVLILLFSRIGAATVETMVFSYYFKKIKQTDIALITLFGNMRTAAIIVVPTIGFILTPITTIYTSLIFIVMSIALLLGALQVYPMQDTR